MENQLKCEQDEEYLLPFRDLYFAFLRRKSPPLYRNLDPRMPEDIIKYVLDRPRVRSVIEELAREGDCDQNKIWSRAQKILADMGHSQQLGAIRCVGYTLKKAFDKMYEAVHVNREGIERVSVCAPTKMWYYWNRS